MPNRPKIAGKVDVGDLLWIALAGFAVVVVCSLVAMCLH
jgi:hypothetical protein